MSSVYERFPLPEDERKALVKVSLISEAMILAAGVVLAIVLSGLSSGWSYSLRFGWLTDIASAMRPSWAMLVLPVTMIGIVLLVDKGGLKFSPSYRKAKLELVQGTTGELPRIRPLDMVICMGAAGICEELLFRYCAIGLVMLALTRFLPWLPAAIITVIVTSVAFWSIHSQYRDPWSIALALSGGLILGAGYVATGSLLSCMFAHALYNIAVLLDEQRNMLKDPDYFGGKIPNDAITKMGDKGSGSSAD